MIWSCFKTIGDSQAIQHRERLYPWRGQQFNIVEVSIGFLWAFQPQQMIETLPLCTSNGLEQEAQVREENRIKLRFKTFM